MNESFIVTQNALPSKWEAVVAEGVGVVGRHYGESFLLVGQLEAPGDSVVQSHCLVQRHVRPAVVVSLVDTARWARTGSAYQRVEPLHSFFHL